MFCVGSCADVAPTRLSLGEALRLAQTASATLRAAEAHLRAERARVTSARALEAPLLNLAHAAGTGTGGTDEDIILSQSFQLGSKRRAIVDGAVADLNAGKAGMDLVRLEVAASTEEAYFDAAEADAEERLERENLETTRQFAEAARAQFEAGDIPRSQFLRAQIEVDRAVDALASATTLRSNRHAALGSLAGLSPETPIVLTDPLSPPTGNAIGSEVIGSAMKQRPDLAVSHWALEKSRSELRSARSQGLPDLLIEGRRAALDPSIPGETVRLGLSLPIPGLGRQRSEVRAAQESVREQEALVEEAERLARLDVGSSLRALDQARRSVEAFHSGRLERGKELLEMAKTGYEHGATSYLEYLDAQQVYRQEQADYARALCAYNKALSALRKAVGGKL